MESKDLYVKMTVDLSDPLDRIAAMITLLTQMRSTFDHYEVVCLEHCPTMDELNTDVSETYYGPCTQTEINEVVCCIEKCGDHYHLNCLKLLDM